MRTRHLLVINPNTTVSVTQLLQQHIAAAAGPAVQVSMVTARFGAPYIADEAAYAVAGHAALDAWAHALSIAPQAPDAVLVGCFGDPGLLALRESSAVPVTGLAEAAFFEAAQHGRFAIVTGGERWRPMLQRLADALGYHDHLAGIHTVAPTGAQLAADPEWARAVMAQACQEALARFDVKALILGGAGLAGLARAVQDQVRVPVIDSVLAGARQSLALAPLHGPTRGESGFECSWSALSGEMMALAKPASGG